MHTRKAARVFPEPVGAAISVSRPAAISRQPPVWGAVGPSGKVRSNHVRTAGWNVSSMRPLYRWQLTTSLVGVGRAPPAKHWEIGVRSTISLRFGSAFRGYHLGQSTTERRAK